MFNKVSKLQINERQLRWDSPGLMLYYLSAWLKINLWRALLRKKRVILELGESQPGSFAHLFWFPTDGIDHFCSNSISLLCYKTRKLKSKSDTKSWNKKSCYNTTSYIKFIQLIRNIIKQFKNVIKYFSELFLCGP